MAERRKIIIETGGSEESLPAPHFDTEATLTARPVVPLSDQEIHQMSYGVQAGRSAAKPFWRRPALLALIVFVAVGIGVAAGLAIGVYRNRRTAEAPVTNAPTSTVENAEPMQTIEPPPAPTPIPAEQARAVVPDEPDVTPGEPETESPAVQPKVEERTKVEERERATVRNERKKDDDDDEARQPIEEKPAVIRGKKPVKVDEYIIEDGRGERRAEWEQRREERRAERRERRRRGREDEGNIPRGMDRAGREVNRIREIFEGRQP
jgi:type IV secretory pathway VirB10-like protein